MGKRETLAEVRVERTRYFTEAQQSGRQILDLEAQLRKARNRLRLLGDFIAALMGEV